MADDSQAPKAPSAISMVVAGFVLLVILAGALGWKSWAGGKGAAPVAVAVFILQLIAVGLVVVGFGWLITGRLSGFMMSSRNAYSLSKMQMAAWTVVVLAGLSTAAEINIFRYFGQMPLMTVDQNSTTECTKESKDCKPMEPLAIDIPGALLAALGIAAFSFSATPAILALKANQDPTAGQPDAAAQRLSNSTGTPTERITNIGRVIARTHPDEAHLRDLVSGDEVANAGTIDLSKVQQLLITLLLLGTYIGMLISTFSASKAITTLPDLGARFAELMALSHGGYLVYKGVPKPDQPTPAGSGAAGTTSLMRAPEAAPPPPRPQQQPG